MPGDRRWTPPERRRTRSSVALRASGVFEIGVGVALLVAPSAVSAALLGSSADDGGSFAARVLGLALVGFGIVGARSDDPPERRVLLAFIVFNALTAACLIVAGLSGAATGTLLWPAAIAHGALTILLVGRRPFG